MRERCAHTLELEPWTWRCVECGKRWHRTGPAPFMPHAPPCVVTPCTCEEAK